MVAAYGNRAKGRRHYLRSKEETKPGAAMVGPTEKAFIGLLALFLIIAALLFGRRWHLRLLSGLGIPRRLFGASFALTSAKG